MTEPLTYGELMGLCEGHGTSQIYERHLEVIAALRDELDGLRHYQDSAMDEYMKALGFGPDYDRKCSTVVLGMKNLRAECDRLKADWTTAHRINQGHEAMIRRLEAKLAAMTQEREHFLKRWNDEYEAGEALKQRLAASELTVATLREEVKQLEKMLYTG